MTEPTKSLRDQIADLIDENAEVRGEHYNDHAILINADELAASIVELLSLSAPSALENGPAGLADATNDPAAPSLSSLRKGAEVAVKPLEWDLSRMALGYPAKAVSIFGDYTAWEIEDGFWMSPEAHCGRRAGVGLQSALDAAQSDFETRIRSALVSGSREDGDG